MDPNDAFAELSRIELADFDIDAVLSRIAHLAQRAIPGAGEVSVTLLEGGAHTAASTGELAVRLDEWQYERGHGPCLDACAATATLSVPDTGLEQRWPRWAVAAKEAGARSSLSIGLPVHDRVTGALNVYAPAAHGLDDDAISLAQTFAGYAAVALANVHLYETRVALATQVQEAMERRAVIEQAKGVIMGNRHCTPAEAFAVLSGLSQGTGRRLRDVAVTVVAEAAEPRTG